jgi:peptide/nickel transport system permease protein
METQSTDRSYLRELLKSKSGIVGIVMLILLIATSLYVVIAIPQSESYKWQDPAAWQGNPTSVPPTWVNYFGVDAPQSVDLSLNSWAGSSSSSSAAYSASVSFTWEHGVTPSDLLVVPNFSGSAYEVDVIWTKPDGNTVQIDLSSPASGIGYDLTTPSIRQGLIQYIQSQTHTLIESVGPTGELAALFNNDGPNILNSSVQQGTYTVTVQVLGNQALSLSNSKVTLLGDSYGTMGTDSEGRPIDLGVLAGLPWGLEIGVLSAVVGVVGGVFWGGLAGFFGGWRDKVLSWGMLVGIAIPSLAFIIALSYTFPITLLTEALLIAVFSAPFFGIISRSVTLSIRSQTYVEADRAMGVSAARTFFTHFLPRLTPVTIAFTALSVSGGIIFGETLAFLGIEPANVITWGGILNAAISFDASVHGWWWWVLFPGIMIIVSSLPFVLVGFALDRIVAPRVSAK